jgi:DNA polymerase III epsilon subunit-like protein
MSAEASARQEALRRMETTMVGLTMNQLFKLIGRDRFRSFPDDYLVLDTETTGVDFKQDLIWQVGHCLVNGRRPGDRGGVLLDWTRHPKINQAWLKQRLVDTKQKVEFDRDGRPTGKTYHISYERMAAEGVEPEPILREYLNWLREAHQDRLFFIAHNGYRFDAAMFQAHFDRFLGQRWLFDEWELFDTGMVEKASQAMMAPWPTDTMRSFAKRVDSQRLRGIKWSLDQHCVPRYKLVERHHLDMAAAHDAGFDCYLCHLLFEHWRELAAEQAKQAATGA